MAIPTPPTPPAVQTVKNFRTYIQQATGLVKAVKGGSKMLKAITLSPTAVLTTVLNSYMKPAFDLMKRAKQFIP